ncbi:phosphate/phosphite/phosphonate ABC transporter substrate-binding protein [bacterium]|nr:phosphate/phosphite/phosphonate ABC transporter substrate-binding protein [bacterium]
MHKNLQPLLVYLENVTGKTIEFQTGYDYKDTINKFADGTFDFGYIGPSPYILAKEINPHALKILAGIKNKEGEYFQSVIVSKKGSSLVKLSDLKNRSFAFGSPNSTLSYYIPMDMLLQNGVLKELKRYDFLGRHDKVAQYVIMGKYDAGAIKHSVADEYSRYLQVIEKSKPFADFMIVANTAMDKDLTKKIQNALLELKDPDILRSMKSSAIGFELRQESDYDELKRIMQNVSSHKYYEGGSFE